MTIHTDTMDELADNLTAYFEMDGMENWPEIGFEIDDVYTGRPERDVGVMERYVSDYTFDAWVGDQRIYNNITKFSYAICEALGDLEQQDAVRKMIVRMMDAAADERLDEEN